MGLMKVAALQRDEDDFEEEPDRNLRLRFVTNVKTCNDGKVCDFDSQCASGVCRFRTARGVIREYIDVTDEKTCNDGKLCERDSECDSGFCRYRSVRAVIRDNRDGYTRSFKTCRDGRRCIDKSDCDRGGCDYREVSGSVRDRDDRIKTCRNGALCQDHCADSSACKYRPNQWD
eukprot:CCRYP_010867-RB/>CCRYP_010867-RB protein AED:0.12 eAED:0.12 QI:286/1/1/1/0.5/0.6/5/366/173